MGFEFSPGRPVRDEVSRLLVEELDGAVAELRGQREAERVRAVHAARKHLKKARSVLRLVRGPLGEKVYGRENGRLRDAGLRLSAVRDAQVAVATLDALSRRTDGVLPSATVNDVRDVLASRRDAASEQAGGGADLVAEVVAKLATSQDRLARVRLDRGGWKALQGGLVLAYDRGAEAARRAERRPTLDRLHEWRKRVKDSWYHLRLLSPAWPAVLEPLAEQAHRLSELLGDDHDLGVLRAALAGDGGAFDGAAALDTLVGQVDRRRAELQHEAFQLSHRFYAESTKGYSARLAAYWESWRDEAPDGDADAPHPGARRPEPAVLAEPQLPRPLLGSVERAPAAPRPAAIPEPQLAAPALGSVERAPSAPTPPRPAAPVLPTPALGSHEHAASSPSARSGQAPAVPSPRAPAVADEVPAVASRSAADLADEVPTAPSRPVRAGSQGNGAAATVAGRGGAVAAGGTAPTVTGRGGAVAAGGTAPTSPSRRAKTRGPADGDPVVGPAAGATAAPSRPRASARSRASSATAKAPATQEQVVATATGRRYHRPLCTLAGPNARPLTREDAVAKGLEPCASCRP